MKKRRKHEKPKAPLGPMMKFAQEINAGKLLPLKEFQEKYGNLKTAIAGIPILSIAAAGGNLLSVAYINQNGGEVNRTDSEGLTALDQAISKGHYAVTNYLLCAGAKIDKVHKGVFFSIINRHDMNTLLVLRNHRFDPNIASDEEGSLLMAAINKGDTRIVSVLLEMGANVNYALKSGVSVMMVAAACGIDLIGLLQNPSRIELTSQMIFPSDEEIRKQILERLAVEEAKNDTEINQNLNQAIDEFIAKELREVERISAENLSKWPFEEITPEEIGRTLKEIINQIGEVSEEALSRLDTSPAAVTEVNLIDIYRGRKKSIFQDELQSITIRIMRQLEASRQFSRQRFKELSRSIQKQNKANSDVFLERNGSNNFLDSHLLQIRQNIQANYQIDRISLGYSRLSRELYDKAPVVAFAKQIGKITMYPWRAEEIERCLNTAIGSGPYLCYCAIPMHEDMILTEEYNKFLAGSGSFNPLLAYSGAILDIEDMERVLTQAIGTPCTCYGKISAPNGDHCGIFQFFLEIRDDPTASN